MVKKVCQKWDLGIFNLRTRGGFQGARGIRDRSNVICFNCSAYGHFAAECCKPRRDKEQRQEENLAQLQDDEPALFLTEWGKEKLLINEEDVTPKIRKGDEVKGDSNLWYLDNGASKHMTGHRS